MQSLKLLTSQILFNFNVFFNLVAYMARVKILISALVIIPFLTFRNNLILYGEDLLAPRPTPKLEDTPCRLSETALQLLTHYWGWS
jgi:hypothetical protein